MKPGQKWGAVPDLFDLHFDLCTESRLCQMQGGFSPGCGRRDSRNFPRTAVSSWRQTVTKSGDPSRESRKFVIGMCCCCHTSARPSPAHPPFKSGCWQRQSRGLAEDRQQQGPPRLAQAAWLRQPGGSWEYRDKMVGPISGAAGPSVMAGSAGLE